MSVHPAPSSQTPTPSRPLRVACVGDSITFGEGLRGDGWDHSYPAVLAQRLGAGWQVRNFGVSGSTLLCRGDSPYTQTSAYESARAFAADLVIVKLGTNDSKRPRPIAPDAPDNWAHRDDYVPDYLALIAAFRETSPRARFFLCTPAPAFPGNWGIDDATIREEIVPRVFTVARQTRAEVIDLYTALSARADCFPDTVHPNAHGAALIADAVHRRLSAFHTVNYA